MATLVGTTINGTITASTSFSSPKHFNNLNSQRFLEYTTPSSVAILNGSYIDLFGNNNGYERMYGTLRWWASHGYFSTGAIRFQLSEYGLVVTNLLNQSTDPFSVSRYSPTFGTNYLRFQNDDTNGTQGGYTFNIRVSGMPGFSYTSNYITERVR